MKDVIWTVVPLAKAGRSESDHVAAHRTVMGLFPPLGDQPRAEAHILFRVEKEFSRILVQSSMPSSLDQLERLEGGARTVDLDDLCGTGVVNYRIDLYAVARDGSKEYPLDATRATRLWERRATASGLHLLHGGAHDLLSCVTRSSRSGSPARLRVASFSGVAELREPDKVRSALLDGVGRAKAYGCGLLTVLPQ